MGSSSLPVPERKCFQDHDSPRGKRWVAEYPQALVQDKLGALRGPNCQGLRSLPGLQPSWELILSLGHAWPVLSLNPTGRENGLLDTQHSLLPLSIPPEDPCLSKSPTDLPVDHSQCSRVPLSSAELKIIPGVKM